MSKERESTHKITSENGEQQNLQRFIAAFKDEFNSLTEAEKVILALLAEGLHADEISSILQLTDEDVRQSKTKIHKKLSVSNRSGYLKFALAFGLIDF